VFPRPAYIYGLTRPPEERRRDLSGWIEPFAPIATGAAIVLRLLRENGRSSHHVAHHGAFQQMLTTSKVAQLLRLTLSRELPCVPEISANKYALNIRFIGLSGMDRGAVYGGDVEFELTFCNL
jgi:cell division protein ZapD